MLRRGQGGTPGESGRAGSGGAGSDAGPGGTGSRGGGPGDLGPGGAGTGDEAGNLRRRDVRWMSSGLVVAVGTGVGNVLAYGCNLALSRGLGP